MSDFEPYLEASTVTLLVVINLGVLAYLLGLVVVFVGEAALEQIGLLHVGWYATHLSTLAATAGFIALPAIAYGGWRLFHHVLRTARTLEDNQTKEI